MKEIKESWIKIYGYTPSESEILNSYTSGELSLTDEQENELIKHFNIN